MVCVTLRNAGVDSWRRMQQGSTGLSLQEPTLQRSLQSLRLHFTGIYTGV